MTKTLAALLDRVTLLACASGVVLILAWIVLHPMIAVFLQAGMFLTALVWRLAGFGPATLVLRE
jgi:hypothetical protein